jgi:predicted deacylase
MTLADTPTHHLRIHQYAGLAKGPRLLVTGAVHGNEVCGSLAITRLLEQLDRGTLRLLRGTLTCVPVVNPLAYQRGQREGERNLNRNLRECPIPQDYEDRIANQLCPLLAAHEVLLDLHSFQGQGQAFVMLGPRDNQGELEPFAHAAAEAALAVALGPTRIVEGWLSTYELGLRRRAEQGLPSQDPHYGMGSTEYMRACGGYGVTLECGQHADPQAPEVAYRAILRTLVLLGMLAPEAIEAHRPSSPPELLRLYEVVDRAHEGDVFEREWASFDAIAQGQRIGSRHDGTPVLAPADGRIVFPNSKALPGHEWFYLARASDRTID